MSKNLQPDFTGWDKGSQGISVQKASESAKINRKGAQTPHAAASLAIIVQGIEKIPCGSQP
jgi:hypothetical protein